VSRRAAGTNLPAGSARPARLASFLLSRRPVTAQARSAGDTAAEVVRPLLVVAPDDSDRDGLFEELSGRAGFRVEFATTPAAAAQALRDRRVALLIAAPDVPAAAVTDLLASKDRISPDLPVLVIRHRQAAEPAAWARRGVGVLRCPLLPAALSRSVEVVLGMRNGRAG
jgi:DNA-binding NtrC family response regulator